MPATIHLAFKGGPLGVNIAHSDRGPAAAEHRRRWRSNHPALADDDCRLPHDANAVHGEQHYNAVRSTRYRPEFF